MATAPYQTGPGANGTPNTRKLPSTRPMFPAEGFGGEFNAPYLRTGSSVQPPPNYTFNTTPGAGNQTGIDQAWWNQRQQVHDSEVAAVIAQMQAAAGAQAGAVTAGLGGVAAQRQAALYGQQSQLRDIGQATEAGVEGATNNALQRGIYNSGVRQENQLTAIREGAEAEADVRAQTQFRLQSLAAQAAQIRASAAAIRAGSGVQQLQTQLSMNQGFQQNMLNNLLQWGFTPDQAQQIVGNLPTPAGAPSAGGGVVAQ